MSASVHVLAAHVTALVTGADNSRQLLTSVLFGSIVIAPSG
jgi:hypothetical protein